MRLDVDAERAEEQELEKGGLADTLKEIVGRTMPSPRYVRFHEAHVQRYLSRLKAFPPRCSRLWPPNSSVAPSWPAHDVFLQPKLSALWRSGECAGCNPGYGHLLPWHVYHTSLCALPRAGYALAALKEAARHTSGCTIPPLRASEMESASQAR